MIRVLGAGLIAAGCIWLGEKKARRLAMRANILHGLSLALEQMEREVQLRLLPLPALMNELSIRGDSLVRTFFQQVRDRMENLQDTTFDQIWSELTGDIPGLEEADRRILLPLGQILGRYDGPGQASSISFVRKELEQQRERAYAESVRLGRVNE